MAGILAASSFRHMVTPGCDDPAEIIDLQQRLIKE
jgi:hypothetical protein